MFTRVLIRFSVDDGQWAADIFANIPTQTYTESGVASAYIDDLIKKTWTDRDTKESCEFWVREFEDGLKAANEAKAQGREFKWVDPEEMS